MISNSEVEREAQARSAAFMPQKRAGFGSLRTALVLPHLLRRERRAPSASRAARVFPTSAFRLNRLVNQTPLHARRAACAARLGIAWNFSS